MNWTRFLLITAGTVAAASLARAQSEEESAVEKNAGDAIRSLEEATTPTAERPGNDLTVNDLSNLFIPRFWLKPERRWMAGVTTGVEQFFREALDGRRRICIGGDVLARKTPTKPSLLEDLTIDPTDPAAKPFGLISPTLAQEIGKRLACGAVSATGGGFKITPEPVPPKLADDWMTGGVVAPPPAIVPAAPEDPIRPIVPAPAAPPPPAPESPPAETAPPAPTPASKRPAPIWSREREWYWNSHVVPLLTQGKVVVFPVAPMKPDGTTMTEDPYNGGPIDRSKYFPASEAYVLFKVEDEQDYCRYLTDSAALQCKDEAECSTKAHVPHMVQSKTRGWGPNGGTHVFTTNSSPVGKKLIQSAATWDGLFYKPDQDYCGANFHSIWRNPDPARITDPDFVKGRMHLVFNDGDHRIKMVEYNGQKYVLHRYRLTLDPAVDKNSAEFSVARGGAIGFAALEIASWFNRIRPRLAAYLKGKGKTLGSMPEYEGVNFRIPKKGN